MRTTAFILACLFAGFVAAQSSMKEAFQKADQIVTAIKPTQFPDKRVSIVDFGAVANEAETLNHEAINLAILACNQAGGGMVVVPKGDFYTGPITLKSNVNLHLEEGAVLKFTTDRSYYFPAVLTRWEGVDCYNYRPLIYAYGETNIALTGKGTVDGQGSATEWWYMKGGRFTIAGNIDQGKGREKLLMYAETNTPIDRRIMTEEDGLRPQLINFNHCKSVLIEDVKLINSPFWVIHPMFCEDLIVRGVKIESHGPNSDGCDPESCKNVLIEDCLFDTGDDCIAIKSGRNNDGRKWGIPSENIIVRNCVMKDGHGGVVVGSEISGGYRNLFVENCEMDSPNLDRVVRIKTSTCRGGVIENIFVRNIKVGVCKQAVMRINLAYEGGEVCDRSFPPIVRNVHLENITSNGSEYGVLLNGLEQDANIYDIFVNNCEFNNVKKGGNRTTGKVANVNYTNLKINGKQVKK
ncbi:MAG: glycoside hydrolase family 28 protein [Phocaeicola sp.]